MYRSVNVPLPYTVSSGSLPEVTQRVTRSRRDDDEPGNDHSDVDEWRVPAALDDSVGQEETYDVCEGGRERASVEWDTFVSRGRFVIRSLEDSARAKTLRPNQRHRFTQKPAIHSISPPPSLSQPASSVHATKPRAPAPTQPSGAPALPTGLPGSTMGVSGPPHLSWAPSTSPTAPSNYAAPSPYAPSIPTGAAATAALAPSSWPAASHASWAAPAQPQSPHPDLMSSPWGRLAHQIVSRSNAPPATALSHEPSPATPHPGITAPPYAGTFRGRIVGTWTPSLPASSLLHPVASSSPANIPASLSPSRNGASSVASSLRPELIVATHLVEMSTTDTRPPRSHVASRSPSTVAVTQPPRRLTRSPTAPSLRTADTAAPRQLPAPPEPALPRSRSATHQNPGASGHAQHSPRGTVVSSGAVSGPCLAGEPWRQAPYAVKPHRADGADAVEQLRLLLDAQRRIGQQAQRAPVSRSLSAGPRSHATSWSTAQSVPQPGPPAPVVLPTWMDPATALTPAPSLPVSRAGSMVAATLPTHALRSPDPQQRPSIRDASQHIRRSWHDVSRSGGGLDGASGAHSNTAYQEIAQASASSAQRPLQTSHTFASSSHPANIPAATPAHPHTHPATQQPPPQPSAANRTVSAKQALGRSSNAQGAWEEPRRSVVEVHDEAVQGSSSSQRQSQNPQPQHQQRSASLSRPRRSNSQTQTDDTHRTRTSTPDGQRRLRGAPFSHHQHQQQGTSSDPTAPPGARMFYSPYANVAVQTSPTSGARALSPHPSGRNARAAERTGSTGRESREAGVVANGHPTGTQRTRDERPRSAPVPSRLGAEQRQPQTSREGSKAGAQADTSSRDLSSGHPARMPPQRAASHSVSVQASTSSPLVRGTPPADQEQQVPLFPRSGPAQVPGTSDDDVTAFQRMLRSYSPRGGGLQTAPHRGGAKATTRPSLPTSKSRGRLSSSAKDTYTADLRASLKGAVLVERPQVRWDDIVGLAEAKQALFEAVLAPIKFPHLFTGKRTPWRRILLYGPPGTGKTLLAKATAAAAEATFFSISPADLMSRWFGESERLVKQLFELARENRPAIIFIDDVDAMFRTRSETEHEASRRMKNEFLIQIQGVAHDDSDVILLAATNVPWQLDSAFRRRFERSIFVQLPSRAARAKMLRLHVGDTACSLSRGDYEALAMKCRGYSGSDIERLVRDSIMEPVREVMAATHLRLVKGGEVDGRAVAVPCAPQHPDAQPVSSAAMHKVVLLPSRPVALADFVRCLARSRPSVTAREVELFRAFLADQSATSATSTSVNVNS